MDRFKALLDDIFKKESLISLVISNYRGKELEYKKVDIEPVLLKSRLYYQFTYNYDDRVEHRNLLEKEAKEEIVWLIEKGFRQVHIFSLEKDYQVLISKKGKFKTLESKASKTMPDLAHNRTKDYIIEDNKPCDFLIRLGLMGKDGRVYKNSYDKFRQINRFLEMVDDVMDQLDSSRTINIIDFGCGKSYLTFALYYYLVQLKELKVNIIGLDLKKDVIEFCQKLKEELNYDGLDFIQGDINNFDDCREVDMIVTLHACDTATDAALVKAIAWQADVILSVPCCQKEIRRSIDNPTLKPMLKHGIVKEELATLVTDSLRAKVLELLGYEVQLLEFIDIENTPKNTLIRAINKNRQVSQEDLDEYEEFKKFWNLDRLFIEDELEKIDIDIKKIP